MCQSGTTCLVYLRSFSELAHLTKRVGIVQSGHHLIEMQLTLTIIWLKNCSLFVKQQLLTHSLMSTIGL